MISAYSRAAGWQCLAGLLELTLQIGQAAREWRGDPSLDRETRSTLREVEAAATMVKQVEAARRINLRHEASLASLRARSPELFADTESLTRVIDATSTVRPTTTIDTSQTTTGGPGPSTTPRNATSSILSIFPAVWSMVWEVPSQAVSAAAEEAAAWVWHKVLVVWSYLQYVLIIIGIVVICGCGAKAGWFDVTRRQQLAALQANRRSSESSGDTAGELAFMRPWIPPSLTNRAGQARKMSRERTQARRHGPYLDTLEKQRGGGQYGLEPRQIPSCPPFCPMQTPAVTVHASSVDVAQSESMHPSLYKPIPAVTVRTSRI